ncbi:quinol monooxygenase YgiN [Rhizobium sp. BK049]|uniref:putative quinol monooxygenase n=1 Tax=Rhizobium sp. BK049 TaxID=2587095 RepID=UPI001613D828|nr:putative quinol monooxygenase [Rhizobium sp. BK049]MBB3355219.1 quinol monooxygenase YgiN [Rhizobium sp. BK049]
MSAPIKIMAILAERPGRAGDLKQLLFGMVDACRAEPGNLRWDVCQDQADPTRFVLDELYTDKAAIAAHRETPHFQNYFSRINDIAERSALVLDPAKVA